MTTGREPRFGLRLTGAVEPIAAVVAVNLINFVKCVPISSLDTRLGSLRLRIPKLPYGSCLPVLRPHKTAEKALATEVRSRRTNDRKIRGTDADARQNIDDGE